MFDSPVKLPKKLKKKLKKEKLKKKGLKKVKRQLERLKMEGFLVKVRTGSKGKQEERYFILNNETKELSFYQQDNKG